MRAFAVCCVALPATLAFAPRAPRTAPSARRAPVAAPAALPPAFAAVAAAAPKLTWRRLAAAPTLYALMSINEYFTHKYYQHAEFNTSPWFQWLARTFVYGPIGRPVPKTRGGGHVEHHAETLDDMTLKTDAKWRKTKVARMLDDDVFRGTAFTWTVTGIMTIQMLFTTLPVFKFLLGYTLKHTLMALAPAMLLHAAVWNALHPNMHALPDITYRDGVPSSWLAMFRSSWFFRYLYQNHEGHHIVGGKGNYNVACPGTDHLVGTYVPEKVWRPKSRTTYESYHGEAISIEEQIRYAAARNSFGLAAEAPPPAALVPAAR